MKIWFRIALLVQCILPACFAADGVSWITPPPADIEADTPYTLSAAIELTAPPPSGPAPSTVTVTIEIWKNGEKVTSTFGDGGPGTRRATVSYTSTDSGNQTVAWEVRAKAGTPSTFASSDLRLNATTVVHGTVVTPTINNTVVSWVTIPTKVSIYQSFIVQARADDPDGDITLVSVWCDTPGAGDNHAATSSGTTELETPRLPAFNAPSTNGMMYFHARAQDSAGKFSAQQDFAVEVVNPSAPTVEFIVPHQTEVLTNQPIVIQARATDADGDLTSVKVSVVGLPQINESTSAGTSELVTADTPFFASSAGTLVFVAQAMDAGGRTATVRTTEVVVTQSNVAPAIEWLQAPPVSAVANQPFTVQARGTDSDGNLTRVRVWVDSESPHETNSAGASVLDSPAIPLSISTAGSHTIYASATDGVNATDTISRPITINAAPSSVTASITSTVDQPNAPGTVTLSWTTNNATSADITEIGSVALSGSQTLSGLAAGFYSYTITGAGPGGTASHNTTFIINGPVEPGTTNFPWGTIPVGTAPVVPTATAGVGTLTGNLSVDNRGSANYTIPLKIPPGRSGMEPNLALSYSSGAGGGIMGQGWSLSHGFPQMIVRGRTILARDNIVRGVNFDGNDKYYLDGKRLICVEGMEGQPDSKYRTEVDSFVTIEASGSGTNIDTFVVKDKLGRSFTFGKHASATDGYQMGAIIGQTETLAYAYALKRVTDTVGNTIDLSYAELQNTAGTRFGEYVLSEIHYTGNPGQSVAAKARLKFFYNTSSVLSATERPDRTISYIKNRVFARSRRLDAIDVEFDGTRVGHYALDYTVSDNRTRLAGITSYLRNATTDAFESFPRTSFTWTSAAQGAAPLTTSTLPNVPTTFGYRFSGAGDFNGDGKEDFIDARNGMLKVFLGSGSGAYGGGNSWMTLNTSVFPINSESSGSGMTVFVCDLNGDGKKDLVLGVTGMRDLYAVVSTGTSFTGLNGGASPTLITNTDTLFSNPQAHPDGSVTVSTNQTLRNREAGAVASRITLADYSGDGRDDLLIHSYYGELRLYRFNGTGFDAPIITAGINSPLFPSASLSWLDFYESSGSYAPIMSFYQSLAPMPGDFNGDGLTDYGFLEYFAGNMNPFGYSYNKQLSVALAKADGTFKPRHTVTGIGLGGSNGMLQQNMLLLYVLPGDYNGDGLSDFLTRRPDGWALYRSKGEGADGSVSFERASGPPTTFTVGGEELLTYFKPVSNLGWTTWDLDDPPLASGAYPLTTKTRALLETSTGINTMGIDVNQDGLTDLVWYAWNNAADEDAANAGWYVSYSTGAGFAGPLRLTGQPWVSLTSPAVIAPLKTSQLSDPTSVSLHRGGDTNGDGIPEWTYNFSNVDGANVLRGWFMGVGPHGNVLSSTTDGLGRRTDIVYKAAKSDSIYTPGAAVSYPIRDLRAPSPVVSDVFHDTGGTTQAQFSYQYSGNRLDLSGRGGLGFHSFVTLDRQTNLFKYQFLAQSFPMTGLTHRDETYRFLTANNFNIISSHDNTVVFDKVGSAGDTLWPFISQAIEYRWENGAALLTTAGSGLTSDPENLFSKVKPVADAHIVITATSRFDDQTAVQLTLPSVSGYNPSDTSGTANTVVGTTSHATFAGLPGKITHGNLIELKSDFGSGFTETVTTTYEPPVGALTGRVDTVTTSVTSPHVPGSETAPVRKYDYSGNTILIAEEVIDASDDALDLKTTYTRDALGRVTDTTISNTSATGPQTIGTYSVGEFTAFDPLFDAPTTSKNASPYRHATTTGYHQFLGLPISVTDVNGAQVTTQYDALGRTIKVRDELKNRETKTEYNADTSVSVSPPPGVTGGLTLTSAYSVTTTTTVQPIVKTWYDRLGRPIRTTKTGFNDQASTTDTIYNVLGQVIAASNPFGKWTTTTYDALGRVATVTAPNGTVTTNTYAGRATLVAVDAPNLGGVDPLVQTNATVVDAKGRTVRVWNADNVPTFENNKGQTDTTASITFGLDGFGRMRTTALKGQTLQITADYDELGRQTSLDDPDKGGWSYLNNALGQVVRQTDAKSNVTLSTFDPLGRPLTRTTTGDGSTEAATFHYYDTSATAAANAGLHLVAQGTKGWIGAPQREEADTSGAPGFEAAKTINLHYYNAKGLVMLDLAESDGQWFYTYSDYDEFSRVTNVRHYWRPAGHESATDQPYHWQDFGYTYTYDDKSYLLSLQDLNLTTSVSRSWWDNPSYDLLDRVTSVRKGSGHYTQRTFRAEDGVLTAIKTGATVGGTEIQNLSFGFDGLGNLTSRGDVGSGPSEALTYDHLNRLKTSKQGTMVYADNGNITSKPDVGGQTVSITAYDSNRPHAASAYTFNGQTYAISYDGNGNLETRIGGGSTWSMKWAGFDKPRWMAKTIGGTTVGSEFHYNANRSRVMQLEFDQMSGNVPSHYTRKRLYGLSATLEANYKNLAATGAPDWAIDNVRVYVSGPDGTIGAREFRPEKPLAEQEKALVYHYDHLGSITSITPFGSNAAVFAADDSGKSGRYSEDAWGQRRNPLTWLGAPAATTDDGGSDSLTPRGFTGHEMLDDLGLVHMNGRIYDPLLGRFLSADIVVSDPANLQTYNRYSYVRNNPLSFVDPTGYLEATISEEERKKLKDSADAINRIVNEKISPTLEEVKAGKISAEKALIKIRDALNEGFGVGGNNTKVAREVKALGADMVLKGKTAGTKYDGGIPVQDLVGVGARLLDAINPKAKEVITVNGKGEAVYKDEASIADGLNVDGHAIGTDKLDHLFFDGFRMAMKKTDEEALTASDGEEKGNNGFQASGVYSNGDIEAQMGGRKFYHDIYSAAKNKSDYSFDIRSFNLEKMDENKNPNKYTPEMQKRVDANQATYGTGK
jgi:RHS repeat-associated protein